MHELNQALRRVSVIGAAGKMGRGIALLLLQEMACLEARFTGYVGEGDYRLTLIDANEEAMPALKQYLRENLTKFAERNINSLRGWFKANQTLVDNEEMVQAFVEGALNNVHSSSFVESAKQSHLIFEAILEDIDAKVNLFSALKNICSRESYFFSNTSSIPISILAEQSHLPKRLIGFHFYNPPAVQKLLEIITPQDLDPQLRTLAIDLAKRLKKLMVFSEDVAGFIGNGYFIREIAFAFDQIQELASKMPLEEAIWQINEVTQEYLIRPMGIFQLMDYVGIDVCHRIVEIMQRFLPDLYVNLNLMNHLLQHKMAGGQTAEGIPKQGFFRYERNLPAAMYNFKEQTYLPLPAQKSRHPSWKELTKSSPKERKEKLEVYFKNFSKENTLEAELAKKFLASSKQIAQKLVEDGVAHSLQDVTTVLENGFFHLYGPTEVKL